MADVVLVMAFLRWYEPRMIFYPNVPSRNFERTPEDLGLGFEEVWLDADGVRVHVWDIAPAGAVEMRSESAAPCAILFCHGNAGNISHPLEKCRELCALGAGVLIFDYPGYGRSEGAPGEGGAYRAAEAALKYLRERGVAPERTILFGESLGTGVAVDVAARETVGGVILEAAFTSVPDVAQRIFWFLPVRFLVRNRFDSRSKIGRVRAPLLLLHSTGDRIFPIRHAQRLLKEAGGPARLAEMRGSHDGAFFESVEVCRREIARFLREVEAGLRGG
jgi:pimeloyl-ACP methyl ester carboxylesterase